MDEKNPYDAYDLPDYSPDSKPRYRQNSGKNVPEKDTLSPPKERPSIRRRYSKNMLEDEEVHVVRKRLNAQTPKDILAQKYPKESMKRIDYVLIHDNKTLEEMTDEKKKKELQKQLDLRLRFESAMYAEGLQVQEDIHGELTYLKIHVPFWRLAMEAESMRLEMPLIGVCLTF